MGISDLRFGDAFGSWAIGAAMGAVAIFALMHVKSVEIDNPVKSNRAKAYRTLKRAFPSHFWDFRDPGASQASWGGKQYNYNGIPVEGMFNGVDFDATNLRFSALGGYEAPKNL